MYNYSTYNIKICRSKQGDTRIDSRKMLNENVKRQENRRQLSYVLDLGT